MARVLRFYTAAFDVTKERPNPINPIPGESLLLWLREKAKGLVDISAPDSEDWVWYGYAEWKGRKYLLGARASDDKKDGQREWGLQIDKVRSVTERLLGWANMSEDDECAQYFQSLLEREASFRDVSVDPEP
jgi:hypothetical protein